MFTHVTNPKDRTEIVEKVVYILRRDIDRVIKTGTFSPMVHVDLEWNENLDNPEVNPFRSGIILSQIDSEMVRTTIESLGHQVDSLSLDEVVESVRIELESHVDSWNDEMKDLTKDSFNESFDWSCSEFEENLSLKSRFESEDEVVRFVLQYRLFSKFQETLSTKLRLKYQSSLSDSVEWIDRTPPGTIISLGNRTMVKSGWVDIDGSDRIVIKVTSSHLSVV